MSRASYINEYAGAHYDRIILQVPKGQKAILKEYAADQGISLNEYICRLIFKNHNEILDRMQIADKYRKMIQSITGNTKDGYTVQLYDSYVFADTGSGTFFCQTKTELRKCIKKCHVHDI